MSDFFGNHDSKYSEEKIMNNNIIVSDRLIVTDNIK